MTVLKKITLASDYVPSSNDRQIFFKKLRRGSFGRKDTERRTWYEVLRIETRIKTQVRCFAIPSITWILQAETPIA